MNLCLVSFHCCPFSQLGGDGTGGMNVYLRELSASLAVASGVSVDIFTRVQNPEIRDIKYIEPNVRVVHLKGGPEHPLNRKRLFDYLPEFAENLKRFISQNRIVYDLVYSHYWLSGVVGEFLKHRYSLPLAHAYHTLAFLKKRVMGKDYEEHPARFSTEELLASTSDVIVSPSDYEKECIIEEYGISPSKVKVISPGVNRFIFFPLSLHKARSSLGLKEEEKIVLYVGRIEPEKGLETLIRALMRLKNEAPQLFEELKLLVIGGGDKKGEFLKNREIARLTSMVERNGLKEKILFLGSKKHNELQSYYSAADVLVIPSLYESFGLVALESLACGIPVIASRVGEMKRIIEEGSNGFLFSPGDSTSLAAALERIFSQQSSLDSRTEISTDIVKRYSWERTGEETCRTLREIIRRKRLITTRSRCDEILQRV